MKRRIALQAALALGLLALPLTVQASHDSERLTKEVRSELVMLPYYGVFDNLAYKVDGGSITLMGQVTRPTLKSSAENVVKKIEGVTQVNNQIEVLPLSPNDDRIRQQVFQSIYGNSALSTRYGFRAVPSIHIIVNNGRVVLEGAVANQMDKTIANVQANQVSGVFEVSNNLRIDSE